MSASPAYEYHDQLRSERLSTRFLTHDDEKHWSAFFDDVEGTRFLPRYGITDNSELAHAWILRQLKRYEDGRYGLQALIDRKSGEFIGQCGLITQEVDGRTETEVGYHIFKQHRGQGFAPEAARLFLDYAFSVQKKNSVISIIDIGNLPSQRVAAKNGLVREKQTRYMELDVFIYRIYPG